MMIESNIGTIDVNLTSGLAKQHRIKYLSDRLSKTCYFMVSDSYLFNIFNVRSVLVKNLNRTSEKSVTHFCGEDLFRCARYQTNLFASYIMRESHSCQRHVCKGCSSRIYSIVYLRKDTAVVGARLAHSVANCERALRSKIEIRYTLCHIGTTVHVLHAVAEVIASCNIVEQDG